MSSVLVVEDNDIQRKSLTKIISEIDKKLTIYEAKSKDEALKISKENNIDFFYIDISLENSSGLELALEIREFEKYKFSWIVFITTHISYMIQAFKETHCYDYIIKPYAKEEVIKITKQLVLGTNTSKFSKKEDKYIIFNLQKGISIRVNVDEIIFIEVNLRLMTIYTKKGKYKVKKLSLSKVLEMTNCNNIMQSHKSFAINIDFISKIENVNSKLWEISFRNCEEKALLGYKFKDVIMKQFK